MRILEDHNIVTFDVDQTLVLTECPGSYDANRDTVWIGGQVWYPHKAHIAELKRFKARGHMVIIWSQGGHEWAAEVINKLDLVPYVDMVMTKPKWLCDDKPANKAIGDFFYIEELGQRLPKS